MKETSKSFDVVIVGGGVCGSFLAGLLGKKRKVLLIESDTHPSPLGRRISVSGNGRCNFFNEDLLFEDNLPSFIEPLKNHFFHEGRKYPIETLSFLKDKLGIRYFKEGKLYYPYFNRAECVRNPILKALENSLVENKTDFVERIDRKSHSIYLRDEKDPLKYSRLVFCVGGRSYDRKDFEPRLFSSLGLPYRPFLPSLCPLLVAEKIPSYLVGQRLRGKVSLLCGKKVVAMEEGEVLFRRDALSGIAVFQLSRIYDEMVSHGEKGPFSLAVDYSEHDGCSGRGSGMDSLPLFLLRYLKECRKKLFEPLSFRVASCASFENSQVSYGGLDLSSFDWDFSLLEDRAFFAIGECLDVNLPCGGYNIGTSLIEAFVVADSLGGLS